MMKKKKERKIGKERENRKAKLNRVYKKGLYALKNIYSRKKAIRKQTKNSLKINFEKFELKKNPTELQKSNREAKIYKGNKKWD